MEFTAPGLGLLIVLWLGYRLLSNLGKRQEARVRAQREYQEWMNGAPNVRR